MNRSNDKFSTPIQTRSRHLGLKRNTSSIKKELPRNVTTPLNGLGTRTETSATNATTPRPQSEKLRKFHRNGDDFTPTTSSVHQRESVSTNCRPYRLTLSKRMREKMTKKRLEFHMANEMEREDEELKKSQRQEKEENCAIEVNDRKSEKCKESAIAKSAVQFVNEAANESLTAEAIAKTPLDLEPEDMSREELMAGIAELRLELNARQEHALRVQELQQAINTWKIGFSSALSDLQDKITPNYEIETLLEHLHIPKEMLRYVND